MNKSFFKIARDISIRKTKDLNTVFDSNRDKVYFLNDTAFFVLKKCNKKINFKKIADSMEKTFRIKNDKKMLVLKDINLIIKTFLRKGLVKRVK